jgi:hypothetical protein
VVLATLCDGAVLAAPDCVGAVTYARFKYTAQSCNKTTNLQTSCRPNPYPGIPFCTGLPELCGDTVVATAALREQGTATVVNIGEQFVDVGNNGGLGTIALDLCNAEGCGCLLQTLQIILSESCLSIGDIFGALQREEFWS